MLRTNARDQLRAMDFCVFYWTVIEKNKVLTHCEGTQTFIDKDKTTFVNFPSYGLIYFAHFAENFPKWSTENFTKT